jgi:hypothetical protein
MIAWIVQLLLDHVRYLDEHVFSDRGKNDG